jgi:hypothetical protein
MAILGSRRSIFDGRWGKELSGGWWATPTNKTRMWIDGAPDYVLANDALYNVVKGMSEDENRNNTIRKNLKQVKDLMPKDEPSDAAEGAKDDSNVTSMHKYRDRKSPPTEDEDGVPF